MDLEKYFRLSEAKLLAANGNLIGASEIISAALSANPNDPDARETLAEIVGSKGRKDLEITILAELLIEFPASWRMAQSLFNALMSEARDEEAKEFLLGFAIANPEIQEAVATCDSMGLAPGK